MHWLSQWATVFAACWMAASPRSVFADMQRDELRHEEAIYSMYRDWARWQHLQLSTNTAVTYCSRLCDLDHFHCVASAYSQRPSTAYFYASLIRASVLYHGPYLSVPAPCTQDISVLLVCRPVLAYVSQQLYFRQLHTHGVLSTAAASGAHGSAKAARTRLGS